MTNRSVLFKRLYFFSSFLICALFSIQAVAEEKTPCNPLSFYLDNEKVFLLRSTFEIIRDVFSKIAEGMWGALAPALQGVIAVGVAVYIAMYTLRNVGSFSNQDVSAYLTGNKGGIIPILIKGALIILLLGHEENVYDWLVAPIIEVGATFGGLSSSSDYAFENVSDVKSLFNVVINQAENFNRKSYQIVVMGRILLCASFLPTSIWDWHWTLVPFGVTLFTFGWLIIIGVSFFMMDLLFRLGVGCAVLPLALACALSKFTVNYTKQTWSLFINVAFSFVMLNLIVTFALEMINASLGFLATATLVGGLKDLLDAGPITESTANLLVESLAIRGFVLMTLSCLIAFKLCMDTENIVKKISGIQAVGNVAQKLGGSAAELGKNVALTPVKHAKNITGIATTETGKSLAKYTGLTTLATKAKHLKNQTRSWVKRNVFRLND